MQLSDQNRICLPSISPELRSVCNTHTQDNTI